MTIACLGWGSLVWAPRELPVASPWHSDGPRLPVEFARKSQDGRITLVLVEGAATVPVLWCELQSSTPEDARLSLADREGISRKNASRLIGMWSATTKVGGSPADTIGDWAKARGIDGSSTD